MMDKVAVDQKAKDYWSKYFAEYGKMWVKDVPRRIKQATRREAKGKMAEGVVVPLAKNITEDMLSVEAAFVGKIDDQDVKILVMASFDNEGKMKEFESSRIA